MAERHIQIKRIYDPATKDDGYRVLVDRLWPRGVKKEDARIDLWAKEVAPTTQLRNWFNHDANRFAEFSARYIRELQANEAILKDILDRAGKKRLTLLFAARDSTCNHAIVLQHHLEQLTLHGDLNT